MLGEFPTARQVSPDNPGRKLVRPPLIFGAFAEIHARSQKGNDHSIGEGRDHVLKVLL